MSSPEPAPNDAEDKMHDSVQLNSESMNEAMQKHMAAHHGEAADKIKQHDAASGHSCPAHMSIPGAATQVNVFRLVAVTGERFLHAFQNLSAPTVPSKRRAGLRSRPDADNDNAGGSRASSAPDSDAMERTQTSQTGAEAAAAEAFVSIVEIRAPESLTPQQVLDLADLAQLFIADAILAALPAYVKPLFSKADLGEVASVLSGLTRTLSSRSCMHVALLALYKNAWARFAAERDALWDDNDVLQTHVQLLLSGSVDACVPPGRCVSFFLGAADQSDLPSGLRLFYILAATLAMSALGPEELKEAGGEEAAAALVSTHLGFSSAHKTLLMPSGLQEALCRVLCFAQRHTACAAVHTLSEAVMLGSARLLTRASPVLLGSQQSVGHMLAHSAAQRRAVVAARLSVDSESEDRNWMSGWVDGFRVSVEKTCASSGRGRPPEPWLGMFLDVSSASEESPQAVTCSFGLAADSEAALSALERAAQQWCSGEVPEPPKPRRGKWAMVETSDLEIADDPYGVGEAFDSVDCKALGYDLSGTPDVIGLAWCEWPAPGSAGPAEAAQGEV